MRILKVLNILTMISVGFTCFATEPETYFVKGDTIYGAKANQLGPIGGAGDYLNIVTKGDYTVTDIEGLVDALSKAKAGQTVFIPGETEIDLTTLIYIEELVLKVPKGVTLAGERGHKGSKGALLTSDALKTPLMIRILGPNVRICGLRLQGPNPKRHLEHHGRSFGEGGKGRDYYYKFPKSNCITTEYAQLEVDNCEISAFSHAGINLVNGAEHHIHHNFIHHCQYNGLGYGVCLNTAFATIEYNIFNYNRHSIAGTGRIGCSYVARHNVQLGVSLSHCFDMHGGSDRKDNTDIAGTKIEIYNNTFIGPKLPIKVRGIPEETCDVYRNWFTKHAKDKMVVNASKKTIVKNNAYKDSVIK